MTRPWDPKKISVRQAYCWPDYPKLKGWLVVSPVPLRLVEADPRDHDYPGMRVYRFHSFHNAALIANSYQTTAKILQAEAP